MQALDWVYRWGWSSPSTIDSLAGTVRRGLAARLVRQGLLRSTRTASGGGVKGVPATILTLTATGLSVVERVRESLLAYELDPYRYRQDQLRHYQLAQAATDQGLQLGKISSFQTEKEYAALSEAGIKQPDIIWFLPQGLKTGVEVELSAKWGRELDHFILACLRALQAKDGQPATLDFIALVSDSPAILNRYQAAFQPGAKFNRWRKDERSRWEVADAVQVPIWAKGKLQCRLIND